MDRVIDVDTCDTVSLGRVRLADIDTPVVGEPGIDEAYDFVTGLVLKEEVYLDIDDVDGKDRDGRWIAVVYVRHNVAHQLNVNEMLPQADPRTYGTSPTSSTPERGWCASTARWRP